MEIDRKMKDFGDGIVYERWGISGDQIYILFVLPFHSCLKIKSLDF